MTNGRKTYYCDISMCYAEATQTVATSALGTQYNFDKSLAGQSKTTHAGPGADLTRQGECALGWLPLFARKVLS
jgi:hypothetical protein